MKVAFELIASRSLNFVRREHPATYVALRMLLDSVDLGDSNAWLRQYLLGRAKAGRHQSYGSYLVHKAAGAAGHEYRKCVVPSPTSLLTEVWALSVLARDSQFLPHSAVYSYLWGAPEAPHIYEYFIEGFLRRERDVATACARLGTDAQIVMVDIKNFYGSIPLRNLKERVVAAIEASEFQDPERELVRFVLEGYFADGRREKGVPIGPPSGHFLAQFYLKGLDRQLAAQYPGRYFRYVDDIAVVCAARDAAQVRSQIHAAIGDVELAPNPNKEELCSGVDWIEHARRNAVTKDDPFARIQQSARKWAKRLGDVEPLQKALRDEGVNLPIVAMRPRGLGGLERLRRLVLRRLFRGAVPVLRRDAAAARADLHARLTDAQRTEVPVAGVSRRWHVQAMRFATNRLLQLERPSPGALSREHFDLLELRPLQAVVRALSDGDATALVPFAGPTVTMAARLWVASNDSHMKVNLAEVKDPPSRQSVYTLWLFGAVEPNIEWLSTVERSGERGFAEFCANANVAPKGSRPFRYIDEIRSLQCTAREPGWAKLRTRHDEYEDVDDDLSDLFS